MCFHSLVGQKTLTREMVAFKVVYKDDLGLLSLYHNHAFSIGRNTDDNPQYINVGDEGELHPPGFFAFEKRKDALTWKLYPQVIVRVTVPKGTTVVMGMQDGPGYSVLPSICSPVIDIAEKDYNRTLKTRNCIVIKVRSAA